MPVPESSAPEILTEAGKDSLIGFVSDAITQTFDDTVYQITDLPGFIADTNNVGPYANVSRQAGRLACRSWARGGGPQNLPGFDAAWGAICEPYLDSIDESPSTGGLDNGFAGGQCPGVLYNVRARVTLPNNPPQITEANLVGPLRYNQDLAAYPDNPGCTGGNSWKRFSIAGSTQTAIISWVGCGAGLEVLSVTPLNGGSNDCGDPPPLYDPPKVKPGLPVVGPQPIDLPGIGPTPIEITFNPDGTLNVDLPDLNTNFDVPVDIGLELGGGDGGGGGGDGPPPGDVGNPGSASDTGPGGDAEGEAPEGSVLTGVRVQILSFPSSRNKYTEEVFRGAYYVYMGVPGLLDLDFGGAMVRTDQFFFAEKDNLTAWRVRANTNYELRATPYYREVE